ncbi:hypothetical protein ACQ4PT_045261 [Festuca glaucescens]
MGRLFLMSLAPTGTIYSCKHCGTPLAYAHQILSRMFRCKHGKAYLFDKVVNVNAGEKDDRMMTTGLHTVCDIFCVACGSILGWKYVSAFEKDQRYKEGKFILERSKPTYSLLCSHSLLNLLPHETTSYSLTFVDTIFTHSC